MRAIRVHEFGDPEVLRLEELPEPLPVDDEVLVRVQAAGVNPYETYVRSGDYAQLPALPYTPGRRRRRACLVRRPARASTSSGSLSGTYAEFALCRRDQVHPLPDDLSYAQGAALGVPYVTAYRALFQRAPRRSPARRCSCTAPAAAWASPPCSSRWPPASRVVGTAGSEAGRDLVARRRAPCASSTTATRAHLAAAVEATGGRGFDLIVELLANVNLGDDLTALAHARPRGRRRQPGHRGASTRATS